MCEVPALGGTTTAADMALSEIRATDEEVVMSPRARQAILTGLIDTCKDAERGFVAAAQEARTPELRRLLFRLAEQRQEFAEDLLPHVSRPRKNGDAYGTRLGALHRAWIHLRAHCATDPDRAVIEETARGEQMADTAYEAALNHLAPDIHTVVETHELGMRVARQLVCNFAGR
jgi:uncharacterized protein (TIGR02284 family)